MRMIGHGVLDYAVAPSMCVLPGHERILGKILQAIVRLLLLLLLVLPNALARSRTPVFRWEASRRGRDCWTGKSTVSSNGLNFIPTVTLRV